MTRNDGPESLKELLRLAPARSSKRNLDTKPQRVVSSGRRTRNTEAAEGPRKEGAKMAPNAKTAFEAASKTGTLVISVKEGTCGDGCGQAVSKGRTFKQGHDAALRGLLGRAYKADIPVKMNGKESSAEAALKSHGFPIPPATKPRTRKTSTKKSTAKKSAAKKSTRKPGTRKPRVKRATATPAS